MVRTQVGTVSATVVGRPVWSPDRAPSNASNRWARPSGLSPIAPRSTRSTPVGRTSPRTPARSTGARARLSGRRHRRGRSIERGDAITPSRRPPTTRGWLSMSSLPDAPEVGQPVDPAGGRRTAGRFEPGPHGMPRLGLGAQCGRQDLWRKRRRGTASATDFDKIALTESRMVPDQRATRTGWASRCARRVSIPRPSARVSTPYARRSMPRSRPGSMPTPVWRFRPKDLI